MDGAEAPVPTPRPIKCYHCNSNKSWDHCDRVREVVSCSDDDLVLTESAAAFYKGCFDSSECDEDDNCKFESDDQSLTITKSDFSCCTKDLCNEAIVVSMVSVIILLACALEAVLL